MSPSQETSVIAGAVAGAMSLLALMLIAFMCNYRGRKLLRREGEPQTDVELGNVPGHQDHCMWFARDSISILRTRQTMHRPILPARTASPGASSVFERLPTSVPVAISDGHDAPVAESFVDETCPPGGNGSNIGEGAIVPPEEQEDEGREVAVAEGGLKSEGFPVDLSCRAKRRGLERL